MLNLAENEIKRPLVSSSGDLGYHENLASLRLLLWRPPLADLPHSLLSLYLVRSSWLHSRIPCSVHCSLRLLIPCVSSSGDLVIWVIIIVRAGQSSWLQRDWDLFCVATSLPLFRSSYLSPRRDWDLSPSDPLCILKSPGVSLSSRYLFPSFFCRLDVY